MGVIHKLKSEVLNFIIENKQNNSAISCRQLTLLILEQFQIKVSKSSINAIFKKNDLSMPIGRRRMQKKKKFNLPVLPVIQETKAVMVVTETALEFTNKPIIANLPLANPAPSLAETADDEAILKTGSQQAMQFKDEDKKEESSLEEKRIKEAQEWAVKLQEEERIRMEQKLSLEKQRLKDEDETRKRDLEATRQTATENKRLEEEARRQEEEKVAEKAAEEAGLRAEKERWAKLAEEDQKLKQSVNREEAALPKVEAPALEIFPEERVCSGAIILKALDCLIGGSQEINAAISRATGGRPEDTLKLTEALIFKSLFERGNFSSLGNLIGVQYSQEQLSDYYAQIKQSTGIGLEITGIISKIFTEAKGVKVNFIDGSVIHLDGQLYSSWPAERFPSDFSNTVYALKKNLNKYFISGQPLVLFSPPGYDILPKDFLNLLLNFSSQDNAPHSLTLFGNRLEELGSISLNHEQRGVLIFGLWPWQFTSNRKVNKIGDFYLKHIKEIDRELYLGEIQIDLFRSFLNQSISLKGCAIKTDLKEKICLVILYNGQPEMGVEELAGIYLSRWPNFEEAFKDFHHKIELFTYASTEQKFFPANSLGPDTAGLTLELEEIFTNYIKMLDAYLRWHFLPAEYIAKGFSSTSECFYKLPVKLVASQGKARVRILVSQGYQFLKDLEYLNCRLNERQINAALGKLFWFESAFK